MKYILLFILIIILIIFYLFAFICGFIWNFKIYTWRNYMGDKNLIETFKKILNSHNKKVIYNPE